MRHQAVSPAIRVWYPSFDPRRRVARTTGGFSVTVLYLVAGLAVSSCAPRDRVNAASARWKGNTPMSTSTPHPLEFDPIPPFVDDDADPCKLAEAERLSKLVDGVVSLSTSRTLGFVGDDDSAGHVFAGHVMTDDESEFIFLDDRRPDAFEVQLVAELRRIGDFYRGLADRIEQENATPST